VILWRKKLQCLIRRQKGQAMVEAAFALPIVLLLFGGCLQLIQIGISTIVVKVAVYEAARQAHMDKQDLGNGRQVAQEICKTLSSGATEFDYEDGAYRVVHHLNALIPVIGDVAITQKVPGYLFQAGE